MKKKEYIIPIFIPFLGCPHDCAFCNQVKITNYRDKVNEENIIGEIEKNLNYFPKNDNIKEIAFFGGSFTGLPLDTMKAYLKIARSYKEKGIIDRIRLSTRPDYINNSILDILKEEKVDIIELGIQSLDEQILKANERGHRVDDSYKASKLIKSYGFTLGHQIMPGLFKDSKEKTIRTGLMSANIGPDIVRIYPTLVIKDTKLEKYYKKGIYQPLTLEEASEVSAELLMIYRTMGIKVIRIGLQVTENINDKKDVIAGPFHPAMGQLVESLIYRIYLEDLIKKEDIKGDISIFTDNRSISLIAGNKKANKKYFYDKYGIKMTFQANKEKSYIENKGKIIDLDQDGFIRSWVKKNYGGDLKLD
ncbi:MAG: radical SAM protein [Anaerococcus sp.]|nr:radical SAM protein [Anaerococcus sp.]